MTSKVKWQRVGLALLDALMIALAVFAAYQIRFLDDPFFRQYYARQFLAVVPVVVALRLVLLWAFNLYRGILRYAGAHELIAIFLSTALGSAVLLGLNTLLVPLIPRTAELPVRHLERVPLSVLILEGLLTFLLVSAARFSRRLLLTGFYRRRNPGATRRVVIVGAGDAGEAVARQMLQARTAAYCPVAFVDDDPHKRGHRIHRVPVAGTLENISEVIANHAADEVLVTIGGIAPARLREIVSRCEHAHVNFRILPHVKDVLTGRVSINQIRPVEIEDLLGRPPIQLELGADRNYVQNQTILITGAGGSIGSELCRQVLTLQPRRMVLFGHGENSIYEISQELGARAAAAGLPRDFVVPVIGEIREMTKVDAAFRTWKPAIVFHAAAHKHVPLMELHPEEAVKNNVTGTMNVARAAEAHGARKFIMISSDKAVRPTNVMGATKRVAEMAVFCMARSSATQFVAVRFGNVLGSRGSVVPLFKKQIAQGGPVTLTHPDVVRYFMTIPEAVSLVIQAGSMDEQRRLYLLDMGQPVRILDLARNLISLSGFDPDRDIEIRYTGLRPGEKLKEELLTAGEDVRATEHGKIFTTEPEEVDCEELRRQIALLEERAAVLDAEGVREMLARIVPDYGPEQI